jgi:transcriptional regulator with XRE-family HTH domain
MSNDVRRAALDRRNRLIEPTPEMLIAHDYSRMLGARIRRLRNELDLTQAETVNLVEHPRGGRYSTGLLSRIEKGWANPPLFVYIHIAEVLGVEPAVLLGAEEPRLDAGPPRDSGR